MKTIHKRFVEYFLIEIGLSVLGTCFLTGVLSRRTVATTVGVMLLCLIIHAVYIFRVSFLYRKRASKKRYFEVTLKVFFTFALVNILMAILDLEPVYTYLFMPYKLFAILGMHKVASAIVINLAMLAMISVIPWIKKPRFRKLKQKIKRLKAKKNYKKNLKSHR